MEKVNVAIIGAGVIGLSTAACLSKIARPLYVIEKNHSFGQETSSRNSEVIHSGIYYPTDSLKAKLCVSGNRLLYELCEKYNIPHKRIGKFIVVVRNEEEEDLQKLFKRGYANGALNIKLISGNELKNLEPNIQAKCALYSPDTGIIDSHSLMRHFERKIKENKGEIVYGCKVFGIEKLNDGYQVTVKEADKEIFKFKTKILVNCAGLNSDVIAQMAGIDIDKENYRLKYCKGQYFRVNNTNKCRLVNSLIYPVPRERIAGLGVHITKDLSGYLRLGPDANYVDRNNFNFEVDILQKKNFLNSVLKFFPFLDENDLVPDTSGIRPKLQADNEDFRDFVIKEESDKGLGGMINLIGIESPGLTSAPAIAQYVEELTRKII